MAAFMWWSAHQTLNHASYFLYTLRLSENVGERLCLPVPTLSKILHKMPDHPTHTTSIKLASPYNKKAEARTVGLEAYEEACHKAGNQFWGVRRYRLGIFLEKKKDCLYMCTLLDTLLKQQAKYLPRINKVFFDVIHTLKTTSMPASRNLRSSNAYLELIPK